MHSHFEDSRRRESVATMSINQPDPVEDISLISCTDSDSDAYDTAIPYTSELHLIRPELSPVKSEPRHENLVLLEELEQELRRLEKMGEKHNVIIHKSPRDVIHHTTMTDYLDEYGPFPLKRTTSAIIMRDVCYALLFLHNKGMHGVVSGENVVVDGEHRGHVVVGNTLRTKDDPVLEGCHPLADDMFRLGELFYRMVTGVEATFNEEDQLNELPIRSFPLDKKAVLLATTLVSKFPQMRPTAGGVMYHQWIEDHADEEIKYMQLH